MGLGYFCTVWVSPELMMEDLFIPCVTLSFRELVVREPALQCVFSVLRKLNYKLAKEVVTFCEVLSSCIFIRFHLNSAAFLLSV